MITTLENTTMVPWKASGELLSALRLRFSITKKVNTEPSRWRTDGRKAA
jgi:hypothetical protein